MALRHCEGLSKAGTPCRRLAAVGALCCLHHEAAQKASLPLEQCITITFSDVVENGPGMEQIGTRLHALGELFTVAYLTELHERYAGSELIDLSLTQENVPACLLVLRGFCDTPNDIVDELLALQWDTKALFRGQVKNKIARHNLCFSAASRDACYERGQGTVVGFDRVPHLSAMRERVRVLLPDPEFVPQAEGNLYYDTTKTYIGLHGDTERTFVIGLRLGSPIPLHFQWFHMKQKIGACQTVQLHSGDVYIMSHKAVGSDWKRWKTPTLRHAAGDARLIKGL